MPRPRAHYFESFQAELDSDTGDGNSVNVLKQYQWNLNKIRKRRVVSPAAKTGELKADRWNLSRQNRDASSVSSGAGRRPWLALLRPYHGTLVEKFHVDCRTCAGRADRADGAEPAESSGASFRGNL